MAPGVLALAHVRGGVVTAVRALGETGRTLVQIEACRMAPVTLREIVQAGTPTPASPLSPMYSRGSPGARNR